MRKVSKKQAAINRELKKVYAQIAEERPHYCTGCGITGPLDHSHIISRKRRPDLQTDPSNITYHCRECHNIHENGNRKLLADYDINMRYIAEVDQQEYQKLISKAA